MQMPWTDPLAILTQYEWMEAQESEFFNASQIILINQV